MEATWVADCLVARHMVRSAALEVDRKFALTLAPSLWRYEVGNVMRQFVRAGKVLPHVGAEMLSLAESFVRRAEERIPPEEVLAFAAQKELKTFYDASYAWLAVKMIIPLDLCDAEVLRKCPEIDRP